MTTPDSNPFGWAREKNLRRGALKLTLKALKDGWPIGDEDRAALRAEMEWLKRSPGVRDRELPTVDAILAMLDGGPAVRERRRREAKAGA